MRFSNGYIPDAVQAFEAKKRGVPSDRQRLVGKVVPYGDNTQTPAVIAWDEFKAVLETGKPAKRTDWWNVGEGANLFTESQGSMPNCAGFAAANASQIKVLLQTVNDFSEQVPKPFNPQGTWQKTKKGSISGGQTISAIAEGIREIGNCLIEDIGEYSDRKSLRVLPEKALENAALHQCAVCIYEGSAAQAFDWVLKACEQGYSVIVGNYPAVANGTFKDANGVECVKLSGQWAHATCFGGFQKKGGVRYAFWVNSHGNLYRSNDGTPAFGGWMAEDTLKRFSSGQFFDVAFVIWAEACFDPHAEKTLNYE